MTLRVLAWFDCSRPECPSTTRPHSEMHGVTAVGAARRHAHSLGWRLLPLGELCATCWDEGYRLDMLGQVQGSDRG